MGSVDADHSYSRRGRDDPKVNGHHPDRDRPLEVVWLCYACHSYVEGRWKRLTSGRLMLPELAQAVNGE